MKPFSRWRVTLVREAGPSPLPASLSNISSVDQAERTLRHFVADLDREVFLACWVSNRNEVLGWELVSMGGLDTTAVFPREVFKGAILAGAAGIIIAHNHPSGQTSPSKDDIDVTERLRKAGSILGIVVLDHLILSHNRPSYSFSQEGHL